jgi:hypothetical protein
MKTENGVSVVKQANVVLVSHKPSEYLCSRWSFINFPSSFNTRIGTYVRDSLRAIQT